MHRAERNDRYWSKKIPIGGRPGGGKEAVERALDGDLFLLGGGVSTRTVAAHATVKASNNGGGGDGLECGSDALSTNRRTWKITN